MSEELGYFWNLTLPSMVRVKELLKKSNSFEEFKVLLEKEFGSELVVNYSLDIWKTKKEEVTR